VNQSTPRRQPRMFLVLAAAISGATLVGFISATRRVPVATGYRAPHLPRLSREPAPPAPTYALLLQGRQSDNRTRHVTTLPTLAASAEPGQSDSHDEVAWQARRAARAERRAYDGAPPVIPHPIDQRAFPSCGTCHGQALRVGTKLSPNPSHESYASCTQCHVVARSNVPLMADLPQGPPTENSFQGLESAGKGERAWPGAPPTIPHSTRMRERCSSCHGALSAGLHTSHPLRQSCTQCHALGASLDQRAPVAIDTTRAAGKLP
jgi:cytochrome c-type protein NapB